MAIRNALNLITDGRKQLPDNYRGIIALKVFNGSLLLRHIQKRIQNNEYRMVAAILAIDNNYLFPIKNALHNDIPNGVLNTPSHLFL